MPAFLLCIRCVGLYTCGGRNSLILGALSSDSGVLEVDRMASGFH